MIEYNMYVFIIINIFFTITMESLQDVYDISGCSGENGIFPIILIYSSSLSKSVPNPKIFNIW